MAFWEAPLFSAPTQGEEKVGFLRSSSVFLAHRGEGKIGFLGSSSVFLARRGEGKVGFLGSRIFVTILL